MAGMPQQAASLRQALEDARRAIDTAIRILDDATQPPAAATKKEAAEAAAADDAKRKAGIGLGRAWQGGRWPCGWLTRAPVLTFLWRALPQKSHRRPCIRCCPRRILACDEYAARQLQS